MLINKIKKVQEDDLSEISKYDRILGIQKYLLYMLGVVERISINNFLNFNFTIMKDFRYYIPFLLKFIFSTVSDKYIFNMKF